MPTTDRFAAGSPAAKNQLPWDQAAEESQREIPAVPAANAAAAGPPPLAATVLVVDDDPSVLNLFKKIFRDSPVTILTASSAADGMQLISDHRPDVAILDIVLPDRSGLELFRRIAAVDAKLPVIFITATGTSDTAIEAMKLGAFDYLLKPLERGANSRGRGAGLRDPPAHARAGRRGRSRRPNTSDDILVGRCAAMQEVYKAIGRVASQNVTVLIRGESGTGKELVARAIYHHSRAPDEAVPGGQLRGHPRAAAGKRAVRSRERRLHRRRQQAHRQVRAVLGRHVVPRRSRRHDAAVQSKLLRLLQEQRFERVGGNETIQTDVRIIAATNRDLEQMVADGLFRADLYYRLNGFTIELPPLRERRDDIMVLLDHFLMRFSRELGKDVHAICPEALELLLRHDWPGNVRELQSVLKQSLLHATGPVLVPEFLPEQIKTRKAGPTAETKADVQHTDGWESFVTRRLQAGSEDLYAESLNLMEKFLIARVLRHTAGNQSQAAKILGITRGCLRNKIRSLGISIGQVVSVEQEPADEAESRSPAYAGTA